MEYKKFAQTEGLNRKQVKVGRAILDSGQKVSKKQLRESLSAFKEAVEVNASDFQDYVDVQRSGATNMFMVSRVMDLSGLSKEQIMYIMKNYDTLAKKFNIKESLDNGPSDQEVQKMAMKLYGANWDALGSKEMDIIYKKLGYPQGA